MADRRSMLHFFMILLFVRVKKLCMGLVDTTVVVGLRLLQLGRFTGIRLLVLYSSFVGVTL